MSDSYDVVVSAIKAGDEVAGYTIIRPLGEGGMGKVFLAEDAVTGHQVAIKMLYGSAASSAALVARFKKEAGAVKKIGSKAFVKAEKFGIHEQRPFIAMEFLDGRSLGDAMKTEMRIAVGRACHLLIQVARALHAAHQQGVIHRDIKPDNIFLLRGEGPIEEVKLLDLGIAKFVEDEGTLDRTKSSVVMGTPHTMSPEQCLSSTKIDHRSDIYSLGVVGYFMLTGTWPFNHSEFGAFIVSHIQDPPPPLRSLASWVPEELAEIIHKCLEKKPDARYQTMAELADALTPLADVTMPLPASLPTLQGQRPSPTTHSSSSGEIRPATQAPTEAPSRIAAYAALAVTVIGVAATGTFYLAKSSKTTPAATPSSMEAPATAKPTPPVQPSEAPVVASGRVLVSTIPGGATVTIDGRMRGQTPLLVSGKPGETLQVHLALEGHEERLVPVAIAEGDRKAEFALTVLAAQPKTKAASSKSSEPRKSTKKSTNDDYMGDPFNK